MSQESEFDTGGPGRSDGPGRPPGPDELDGSDVPGEPQDFTGDDTTVQGQTSNLQNISGPSNPEIPKIAQDIINESIANQIDINNIQEFVDANTVEIDEPPAVTFPHRPAPDFSEFDKYICCE